nr:hypothetical protein L204_03426 [Cryptococcus depauperatus CBS 7855]
MHLVRSHTSKHTKQRFSITVVKGVKEFDLKEKARSITTVPRAVDNDILPARSCLTIPKLNLAHTKSFCLQLIVSASTRPRSSPRPDKRSKEAKEEPRTRKQVIKNTPKTWTSPGTARIRRITKFSSPVDSGPIAASGFVPARSARNGT